MIKITTDVRPATAKKQLIKQGEEYQLKHNGAWISVVADRDQESSKSKKIFVRECKEGEPGDLIWAFINQLVTPEDYEALIAGQAEIAADEAPIEFVPPYVAGDWLHFEAKPGDIRLVECSITPKYDGALVWVIEWKGIARDEFLGRPECLRKVTDQAQLIEAANNKEAVEAKRLEHQLAEAAHNKAERDAIEARILSESAEEAAEGREAAEAAAGEAAAREEAAAAPEPKPIKKGDRFWWQQAPARYRFAVVQEDQVGPDADKVYVLHWAENGNKPKGPVWVNISDLITESEYKKQQQVQAKNQPQTATKGQAEETPATEVKTLFNSPQEFAELMKQQETPEAIKALCDRLLALPRFTAKRGATISPKTKMQRLCDYNKAIKAAQIELVEGKNAIQVQNNDGSTALRHLYFKFVGIIDHDWETARKIAANKVVNKLDHCVEVDADQYLETVKYCLVSDNVYKIFAGLVAASGRRPVEIAYYSNFSYHGAEYGGEHHLLFENQAKKRDHQMDKYGITTIGCTAETFLKYLDIVRNDPKIKSTIDRVNLDDLDALKQISDPIRVQVNREIAKAFSWLPARADESSQTCKTLRSIWAAMVTTLHCKLETNKLLSASRLLGHFEGDPASLLTTLGYSDILIKTTPNSFPKSAKSPVADPDLIADEAEDEDEDGDAPEADAVQTENTIAVDVESVEAEDEDALEAATVEAEDAIEDAAQGEIPLEAAEVMQGPAVDDKVIATAIAMPIPYGEVVAASAGERHPHDFYETPPWAGLAILEYAKISGSVGECCNGNGAISALFEMAGFNVWTNDLDPQKPADYHGDATDPTFWDSLPDTDWIVSNPPYGKLSAPIVINAYNKAKKGIVMVLKMGWWELCQDRVDFLKKHPPTAYINMPRYCYRKGTVTEKWATDEAPTVGYVWDKSITHGLTQLICLPVDDLRLFHRNPDGIPPIEKIEAEVKDIMQKRAPKVETVAPSPAVKGKAKSAKKEAPIDVIPPEGFVSVEPKNIARITEKMQPFLTYNAVLDPSVRWYVGQTIVKAITGCNNTAAHAWINFYKEYLEGHNRGLSSVSTNRGRVFTW